MKLSMFVKEHVRIFIILSFLYSTVAYSQNILSDTTSVFIDDELVRINIYINQSSLDSLLYTTPTGNYPLI